MRRGEEDQGRCQRFGDRDQCMIQNDRDGIGCKRGSVDVAAWFDPILSTKVWHACLGLFDDRWW